MSKPPKMRINKMKRLSTMVNPIIAPSAKARGFAIARIVSNWHDIVGDMSSWCRPDAVSFPSNSRTDGTLKLKIAPGRGPQAQAMSDVIIERVNANFGYRAISRIRLVQTLSTPIQTSNLEPRPHVNEDQFDIWKLDDKLKDVKLPELRAALRRLGRPIDSPVEAETLDHLNNGSKHETD